MPRFNSLPDWLAWQDTLHPEKIELGLERVAAVAGRLQLLQPDVAVITVAGTNGKGSSVALLESVLVAAGYRTGSYTSPHLQRYNERIRIQGKNVDDASLCTAFACVDAARGDETLTYFEFGTLAALVLFSRASLDIAILEVGMGGRLDAVNILENDAALITSISIDHSAWLGADRESIGQEKAGILRAGRPAICSDPQPPLSVANRAGELGAHWYCLGQQFSYQSTGNSWCWQGVDQYYKDLPLPSLAGKHQLDNAAGVLMTLEALAGDYPVTRAAIEQGLQSATLSARCQIQAGDIELVFDVAHNAGSAACLAQMLTNRPVAGATRLVLAMLNDKAINEFTALLASSVDHWYLATLGGERGLTAQGLRERMYRAGIEQDIRCFQDVSGAFRQARAEADNGDRLVVCGSFVTVAEALACHV
ncbi:MAG TPA: bifunctional tetrahydrofolate synthase/dihydrofolate synthase [Gammaproteobacteria bacterium]|nr:bifunctional tetrahydrofolate synthase/dihydrofolate synthase [Gammaproteobacteria bacterium]